MKRIAAFVLGSLILGSCAQQSGVRMDAIMSQTPPTKLADYGLFADSAATTPSPGVHLYTLNTALFSDYADKRRYVYVPAGRKIAYKADGAFEFPVGSVLIKTFEYHARRGDAASPVRTLETRLLVHTKSGWEGRPYIWNAAGTEAVLTPVGGPIGVQIHDEADHIMSIAYRVPNQNQCKTCHLSNGNISPIGPKAANLNRDIDVGGAPINQLTRWSQLGILKDAPNPASAPKNADFTNLSLSVEARSRAWLDINCGHCHKSDGSASNTGLYLTANTVDPSHLGIGRRPVSAGKGSGELLFDVVPGHPEQSILFHRISSTEPGVAMPELGRTVVHEEAVGVIRQWISEMKE
jgi:uncharacterized repeat protein (TIGR03806 family)